MSFSVSSIRDGDGDAGCNRTNGTEKTLWRFAAISTFVFGTLIRRISIRLYSCVGAIVTTGKQTDSFQSYLESKGFEVRENGRINICPLCGKGESASLMDGKIKCFHVGCSLSERGLVSFSDFIKEYDPKDLHNLDDYSEVEGDTRRDIIEVDVQKNHEIFSDAVDFFQEVLFESVSSLHYLTEKRGRTEGSIRHFKVGLVNETDRLYNRLKNRFSIDEIEESGLFRYDGMDMVCTLPQHVYTYPIWWKGKIRTIKFKGEGKNGYVARKYTGQDYCSFLNIEALKKEEFILVEGENDCMRLWELGRNAVAILGSLSSDQISYLKKLRNTKTIFLCFDNDEAGDKYNQKIVKAFEKKRSVTLKQIPYKGADPDVGEDFNWEGTDVDHILKAIEVKRKEELKEEAQFFTDRYVKVEVGSKIIYANKRYRTQWLESRALLEKHGDMREALQEWMDLHAEFAERGVCCNFSTSDFIIDDQFNMFQGFDVQAQKGDLPMKWLRFVEDLICNGDEENYIYLLDWICDIFQNPNNSTAIVPVITSAQGAGKNRFADILLEIIGKLHSVRVDSFDALTGNYNGIIENKLLIHLDEATYGKSKKEQNRFKSLTGNQTMTINKKYQPVYSTDFSGRFIVTSNESAPVSVEVGNRRFFVLEASNERVGDYQYFSDIMEEVNDKKKLAALYHYFCTRKISENYDRYTVKSTVYEKTMMQETLDSVGSWLCEVDEELASPVVNWKTQTVDGKIKLSELYQCYETWYEDNKASIRYEEKPTIIGFGKILRTKYWSDAEYGTFKFGKRAAKGFQLKKEDADDLDKFEKEVEDLNRS